MTTVKQYAGRIDRALKTLQEVRPLLRQKLKIHFAGKNIPQKLRGAVAGGLEHATAKELLAISRGRGFLLVKRWNANAGAEYVRIVTGSTYDDNLQEVKRRAHFLMTGASPHDLVDAFSLTRRITLARKAVTGPVHGPPIEQDLI